MGFFYGLLSAIYGLGAIFFFGRNGGGKATFLRVVLIGILVGYIGYMPLSIAILALALFLWTFSMWHPSTRDVSGLYLGTTVILVVMLGVTGIAKHYL